VCWQVDARTSTSDGEEEMTALTQDRPNFFRMGTCKSEDGSNPDVIEVKVLDTAIFETELSVCCKVEIDGTETILPLKSKTSNNPRALNLWNNGVVNGKIKPGAEFMIKTWLSKSRNDRTMRMFAFQFNGK